MTTECVRAEIVAGFLKGNQRYLELGLEIEAAVDHLRERAKNHLWELVGKELEVPARRFGWNLEPKSDRNSEGWLLHKEEANWTKDPWSGVWVWRLKRDALKCVVGVQGWPESATDFPRSARDAANKSFDRLKLDPWPDYPYNDYQQIGWCIDGDRDVRLLGGSHGEHVKQIVTLVSALLEVADSP